MIISSLTESRRKLVVAVEHNTNEPFMFNGGLCGVPRYLVPPCSTSIDHKSSTKKIAHVIFLTLGITAALLAMSFTMIFYGIERKVRFIGLERNLTSGLLKGFHSLTFYKQLKVMGKAMCSKQGVVDRSID